MALPSRLVRYSRLIDLLVEELLREAEQATPGGNEPTPRAMRRDPPILKAAKPARSVKEPNQ